ncbi:MAG: hydratase [Oscillospiraceae bacterium]|nr:hydratase [Oscillospiraceae bacterium]
MDAIRYSSGAVVIKNGMPVAAHDGSEGTREKSITYRILRAHEAGIPDPDRFHIRFDALVSHDITYVGIIQTARASGLSEFPMPYALTNCHNSLCAVGGTINEDDHVFGLSAARKYGGIYVPANQAVIHQFAREALAGCGRMILGSDSHTRYGCYGCMGVGEGGGELAKQLLRNTWDSDAPEVVLVWVEGKVPHGIGPHDIAIALVGETFPKGLVKNKVLEFAGPGIADMPIDFRIGIDVMTTETSCLSSIWETDDEVRRYYENVGRPEDYSGLRIEDGARYDSMITVDLSRMESMIALPFHPSKAYTIHELQEDPSGILSEIQEECNRSLEGGVQMDLLRTIGKDGKIHVDQGVIGGCAGGMFDNIAEAEDILRGKDIGNGFFDLSVYPSSAPVNLALVQGGITAELLKSGAVLKPCFCGPCFGAGDTPANNSFSVRHTTRNFANREGSKPGQGQIAAVALMDARSIAATAANGGVLTAATDIEYETARREYVYDGSIYEKRCYYGFGDPHPEEQLRFGPNITDWPVMPALTEDITLEMTAVIQDEVTTTDELIPSGETSSYRSNPVALSEFALSRRVPEYVARCKAVRDRQNDTESLLGSCIFARKPGDGSAREQAASCQKVLGGLANICYEYATKRYRSNCINWGIIPFTIDREQEVEFAVGDRVFVPAVRSGILEGREEFDAVLRSGDAEKKIKLYCRGLTPEERKILADGCLINYYAEKLKEA